MAEPKTKVKEAKFDPKRDARFTETRETLRDFFAIIKKGESDLSTKPPRGRE